MAELIQIPRSNSLRFINESAVQNFDNTLLPDEDFPLYASAGADYLQKVKNSDVILTQFATDAAAIGAIVRYEDGSLYSDQTGSIASVLDSASFSVYNLEITLGAAGIFYIELDFDGTIYRSELFRVDGFQKTVQVQYSGSENDGIVYNNSEQFTFNIEGRVAEYQPGMEKTTYTSFNQSATLLKGWPLRFAVLELGGVPRYMIEKLNIALAHDVFKVNGVQYVAEGDVKAEMIRDTFTVTAKYKASIQLREVNYENYLDAAEDAPADTFFILVDVDDNKLSYDGTSNLIWKS
jgi:hypothetical protein